MTRTLHIVYNAGDYCDKAAFILCKTSNPSSKDLQEKQLLNGEVMYESVARLCNGWNSSRIEQQLCECPSSLFDPIVFSSIIPSLSSSLLSSSFPSSSLLFSSLVHGTERVFSQFYLCMIIFLSHSVQRQNAAPKHAYLSSTSLLYSSNLVTYTLQFTSIQFKSLLVHSISYSLCSASINSTQRAAACVGLVAGATDIPALTAVRVAAPDMWILCPGVGAQGGDAQVSYTSPCSSSSHPYLSSPSPPPLNRHLHPHVLPKRLNSNQIKSNLIQFS